MLRKATLCVLLSLCIVRATVAGTSQVPDSGRINVVFAIRPTGNENSDRRGLDVLSRFLEPRIVKLEAETTVSALIKMHCGTAKVAHIEKFLELNPSIDPPTLAEGETVAVPPCPYWQPSAEIVLGAGSVDSQIKMAMGVAGPKTIASVVSDNPKVFNKGPRNLYGKSIVLPYAVDANGFTLKKEYTGKPDVAIDAIGRIPGAFGAFLDPSDLEQLRDVDPAAANGECRAAPSDKWPFDSSAVRQVLKRNERLFPASAKPPRNPIIIGIADTGIQVGETRLPLHITDVEQEGTEDEDRDENDYRHDVIGTVLHEKRGYPLADMRYKFAAHGTGVAGLAVGGLLSGELSEEVRRRIGLKIMSYVQRLSVPADTPLSIFTIPREALLRTLSYRPERQALSVLNLSVQTTESVELFDSQARYASTLIVVAAGNSHVDLDILSIYPAAYKAPNIITVAAHNQISDAEWALIRTKSRTPPAFPVLTSFSNYSGSVDLAAPGCKLLTLGLDGTEATVSGTSFAAPLVSFTAALLMSYRIRSPARVRSRILAAVDVIPGLSVTSSGVLNIPKTLRVFEDQIEMTTGELILGKIENGSFDLNNTHYRIERVLKLVPRTEAGVRLFLRDPVDDDVIIRNGATSTRSIRIRETESGRVRDIPLDLVRDVVFRAPEHRHP